MVNDLGTEGFGFSWGHTRSYNNQMAADDDFGNGYNWLIKQWPYLAWSDGQLVVVKAGKNSLWFSFDGVSAYTGEYGSLATLDEVGSQFVLTMPDGTQEFYANFYSGTPGKLLKCVSPGGVELVVTYGRGLPTLAKRTSADGDTESFVYDYFTSGENSGRLSSVTLQRQPAGGAVINVRRATYTYYGSDDTSGSVGDLMTAVHQVYSGGAWQTLGNCYYRYWTGASGEPGFQHALKFVFQPAAYAALYAAHGNPEGVSDATVAAYADNYFEYDSSGRVTREDVNGGQLTHRLSYTNMPDVGDSNQWTTKTVEQLQDGGSTIVTNTVFTNSIGQVLLKDTTDGANSWYDYQQFDGNYRLLQHALPSAVVSYSVSGSSITPTLAASSGLIQSYQYDDNGYLLFGYAQNGTGGPSVTVNTYTYDDSGPIVQLATSTDALGNTTSYSYAYIGSTSQLAEKITTLPVVDPSQNGSGATVTQREIYDTYGNMIWERGPRGFIDYFTYDVTTGAMTQKIEDVDGSLLSLPTDFVDGSAWITPSGGGANLQTDYTVDNQGRTIQVLGPTHDIILTSTDEDGDTTYSSNARRTATWTIYRDDINEVWTSGGYAAASGDSYAYTIVNPITIQQFDDDGRLLATIQATTDDISGPLTSSYSFPQSSYVAWTAQAYDDSGDLTATRVYKLIPTSGSGSSGTNYDQTSYGYTALGLQNMVRSPGGTITRTVYDALNRVVSVYVGTNDTGATDEDPTGGRASGNSMVCTQTNVYDSGGVGDSNVTQSTVYVDSTGTNNRVTNYGYDWRDRQTSISGPLGFYQENTYDDADHVVQTDRYNVNASGTLLARSQTQYDEQGRVYQKIRWEVDPTSGALGNSLVDNTWYDEAGNVIKSQPSGSQAFTKTSYDGLGRQIAQYTGYFATSGVDDYTTVDETNKIFEQSYTTYDGAGDVLQVTSYQRLHNNYYSYGPLTTSEASARVTYTAFWYDSANRRMFSANYGTNGGTALTRPDVAPASSDSVLVTFYNYGQDTDPFQTVDPTGMDNRWIFDRRHRIIQTIANASDTIAPDTNNSVLTGYSPDGQVASLTAVNPTTGNQTTTYTYGTTLSDSAVARADLLRSVTYPDGGVISYTYNRQGQVTQMTDQNGTVHQYSYDQLGRPTADSVITLGSGIDGAVRRITRTYNTVGLPQNITSYNATTGGTVVNDIQYAYNGFRQIVTEYQSHSGAVNTSSTTVVRYSYADGSQNTVRMTGITYPSGNGAGYEYSSMYGVDDNDMLSRVTSIMDGSGPIVDYVYLGLGTFVQVEYPDPRIRYDVAFGSGSNPYAGLDNFGRVIDCRWRTVSTGSDVERIQYGYDQASNRTWRHNTVAPSGNDELYTYDGLHRLADFQRGTFSGSDRTTITSQTLQQQWTLDATGNWSAFANTDALVPANDVSQTRTHTKANEIATFAASSGSVWAAPHYDAAGNMTVFPQPNNPTTSFTATYDAWNRQVGITGTAAYTYDGVNRRTRKTLAGSWRDYYYSSNWQVLEERLDSSTTPDRQFYWGLRYIDDLVLRDRSSERLYSLQDANWNVTTIVNTSGTLQERYRYTAYGMPVFLSPSFGVASYIVSSFDWETLYAGYRWDTTASSFAVRWRGLHSTVGRWLTRDPVGQSDLGSLYPYVLANPLTLTDPTGLSQRFKWPKQCCDFDAVDEFDGALRRWESDAHHAQNWARRARKFGDDAAWRNANGYLQQVLDTCRAAKKALDLLKSCYGPWTNGQQALFDKLQGLFEQWCGSTPFTIGPAPVPVPQPAPQQLPSINTKYLAIGLIAGTLIEDALTWGGGIADDPVSFAAAGALWVGSAP